MPDASEYISVGAALITSGNGEIEQSLGQHADDLVATGWSMSAVQ